MKTNRPVAFTLVELLAAIAIIALLLALIFPAIQKAITKGEISQTRNEISHIVAAVEGYQADYGKLPVRGNCQGTDILFTGTNDSPPNNYAAHLFHTLCASNGWDNTGHVLNPKRVGYLDIPKNRATANLDYLDSWGSQYKVKVNSDYNNTLVIDGEIMPLGGSVTLTNVNVVVWSAGPDKQASTKDDIFSHQYR